MYFLVSHYCLLVAGLSSDQLRSAAQTMEEIPMKCGDIVIQQDGIELSIINSIPYSTILIIFISSYYRCW